MGKFAGLSLRPQSLLTLSPGPGAFRLFLAMIVFVYHFSSLGLGAFAVYVFFILSGFWLHRMWNERYVRTRQPYLTFIVSRVWRLAPVMMLVSLITVAILPVLGVPTGLVFSAHPVHLVFSSTFLIGYSWMAYLPVLPAWSLDIEMQFYMIAPLLSVLIAFPRQRSVVLAIAAGSSLAIGLLAPDMQAILPKYMVFFVLGMICAEQDWRPSGRAAALSAGVLVAVVLVTLIAPWRGIMIRGAAPADLYNFNPLFNVALSFACLPLAIYTTSLKSDGTDRMMGDMSYIIYLLHWVTTPWFGSIQGPFAARLAVAGASFALVPCGAWLIWKFWDRPINRLRAQWVASRMEERRSAFTTHQRGAPG
ncbi:acyltransferase [Novosphingobium sp. BL-8A]|uniref:acyltransferase family protein n=1 Tax=Novosphingobium sp. BL-8A TaxID=3127639 RepID=UPI003756DA7D